MDYLKSAIRTNRRKPDFTLLLQIGWAHEKCRIMNGYKRRGASKKPRLFYVSGERSTARHKTVEFIIRKT